MPDADAGRNHTDAGGRPKVRPNRAGNTILAACRASRYLYSDGPFPAFSYSLRIDAGHASRWRFAVRVEILLRLQPLFAPILIAVILRAHPGRAAATRRHCGIPPA